MEKINIQSILQVFSLEDASYTTVPNSFSATVYKVTVATNDTYFIKIPYSREKWYREYGWYQFLEGKLPIPKLVNSIQPNTEGNGAFLFTALKGAPIETMTPTLAEQVGRLQATMHELTNDTYGTFSENGFDLLPGNDWRTFIWQAAERFAPFVKSSIEAELFETVWNELQKRFERLPDPAKPSVVHMDFRLGNLIAWGDELSGVIDFESARFGSPELDLIKLYRDALGGNEALRHAYEAGYGTVRPIIPIEQYYAFYELYDAFNSIGWSVQRGIEKNQDFFNEGFRRMMKQLEKSSLSL